MCVVTNHARKRASERLGISCKAIERLSKKVLEKGISQNEATGALKRYTSEVKMKNGKPSDIYYYGEYMYLFRDDALITMYKVPNQISKAIQYNKQKLRG